MWITAATSVEISTGFMKVTLYASTWNSSGGYPQFSHSRGTCSIPGVLYAEFVVGKVTAAHEFSASMSVFPANPHST
jgi:hypothetical protein